MTAPSTRPQPLKTPAQAVLRDWVDYNGHMNVAYYVLAFDRAIDFVYDELGIGEAYAKSGVGSVFAAEMHVRYLSELKEGDRLDIAFQLIGHDEKRIHYFLTMHHAEDGFLAATSEQLALHVSMQTRRSAPFPPQSLTRIEALARAHGGLDTPDGLGRRISLGRAG